MKNPEDPVEINTELVEQVELVIRKPYVQVAGNG
jgi:hypothetical protein